MSLLTYGDILSRVRWKLKAVHQDIWLSDRDIWSLYKPWLNQVMKELDAKNKLMAFSSLFSTLDVVPLIEVDKIEAGCSGLKSGFTFMRTKDPIASLFMEAYWGNMVRSITSIDGSQQLQPITPEGFINIAKLKNFKYNKTLYYYELNSHFYFPNIDWRAVKITALTEEDISEYKCDSDEKCLAKQEQSLNVPDYILGRVESLLFQSLGISLQLQPDQENDNKSSLK